MVRSGRIDGLTHISTGDVESVQPQGGQIDGWPRGRGEGQDYRLIRFSRTKNKGGQIDGGRLKAGNSARRGHLEAETVLRR